MNWSYGILTVASRVSTILPQTMKSLASVGFNRPQLFVDGACDVSTLGDTFTGLVIRHPPAGNLSNWMGAITSLFYSDPKADRYALFEDDLECCPNLRDYLASVPYPAKGYLNLITHDDNLVLAGGKRGWYRSNQKGRGAVGLVFSREAVMDLLGSRDYIKRVANGEDRCADGMVCETLVPLGYTEWVHYPSLIQHVGIESSMNHRYGRVQSFMEGFDPMTLVPAPELKEFKMTETEAIAKMVAPSDIRPSAYRGGIIQIHVTRACDQACHGCTQGSNLAGKPVMITPEEFEIACASLEGYWGVVGMFGGNPAIHPEFERLCLILADHFPKEQRGIWCNHPKGNGTIMRDIFDPMVSNLNVHLSAEAYDEFKRDWPESRPFGIDRPEVPLHLRGDSRHSPPFVAMLDVVPDEGERWELISGCDINRYWSAMIAAIPGKGVRAFFCELAGAQAILHANDSTWPDTGIKLATRDDKGQWWKVWQQGPTGGVNWWELPIQGFAEQIKWHCHRCGVPLKRLGELAIGGNHEEVSATHAEIYRPKVRGREVQLIELGDDVSAKVATVTDYAGNARL